MNCPNCGNSLITKGKYCPYCGTLIPEDILVRVESKQEILDHGRVADAKKEIRKTEERSRRKRYGVIVLAILVIGFIAFIGIMAYVDSPYSGPTMSEREHAENVRLQKIEDEILKYIKDGKYEQAYVMAGTLNYKVDTYSSYYKQWKETRETLEARLEKLLEMEKGSEGEAAAEP